MPVEQLSQATLDGYLLKHPWTILRIVDGENARIPKQIQIYFDTEYPNVFGYAVLDKRGLKVPLSWWDKFKSGYFWPGACRTAGQEGYYLLVNGRMEAYKYPYTGIAGLGTMLGGVLTNTPPGQFLESAEAIQDEEASKQVSEAFQAYLNGYSFKYQEELAAAKKAGLALKARKDEEMRRRADALFDACKKKKCAPPPAMEPEPSKDPWAILEVPRTASYEEVKEAWRRKAADAHPDRLEHVERLPPQFRALAEQMVKDANWAWGAIKDEKGWKKEKSR